MSLSAVRIVSAMLVVAWIVAGCGGLANRNKRISREEPVLADEFAPGQGDAILFDVKIWRKGDKNSLRLEVYHAGDSLALFARGYLGKGVLKGVVGPDSLLVFFPTENEYYAGPVAGLLTDVCPDSLLSERLLLDLFSKTPAQLENLPGRLYVNIIKETSDERVYRLQSQVCSQSVELKYRFRSDHFVPDRIVFEKGEAFKFEAESRKVRPGIDLPPEKFLLEIPSSAIRIDPDS